MSAIHVPDLKTQKYDRQLRLWAATGQTALENAKVCLLHATSTGCEIIKNLVLPGVGSVTIVDSAVVSQNDIQNNFFLEPDNAGHSKACSTAALLKELNDDVATSFVQKSVEDIIHNDPDFFASFDMIIATNVAEKETIALSDICEKINKTVIYVQSRGLCGIFRIQAPEHTIIETHPENVVDLRLGCPFKQLSAHVDGYDLDKLDQTDHGHVPFVVVMLKYLNIWKETHGGEPPKNYSERNEFKNLIKSGMKTADEENFEEAIANVWRLSSSDTVTSNVRDIFQDPACEHITDKTSNFWIIARAVRDFVANEGEGQLPLPGKLPDMKSDTKNYVQLQNVYREKSLQDLESVKQRVHKLLETVNLPADSIPDSMIEGFCKNAAHIKVIRYRSLRQEYTEQRSDKLKSWLEQDENIAFYIIFRAAEKFAQEKNRYPGSQGGDNVADITLLQQLVAPTLTEMGVPEAEAKELATEKTLEKAATNYVRFADQETANIAALMGGLVAQEAIKLITKQYIPVNNTCIFNGIASTSKVYEL